MLRLRVCSVSLARRNAIFQSNSAEVIIGVVVDNVISQAGDCDTEQLMASKLKRLELLTTLEKACLERNAAFSSGGSSVIRDGPKTERSLKVHTSKAQSFEVQSSKSQGSHFQRSKFQSYKVQRLKVHTSKGQSFKLCHCE